MGHRTLLPDSVELGVDSLKNGPGRITVVVHTARTQAACPVCGTLSRRVHSFYTRKLADLPWNGIPVVMQMRTRRFFCMTPTCGQRIFAERLPNSAAAHARRTQRLGLVIDWLTMALGGEAGARLAHRVGILASGDTLLRQLRRKKFIESPRPRVLGMDDWAWRKGHRYGTILCDLERRSVVDLLPDRSVDSVAEWLRAHPGIEIVSRDRASTYAEATRKVLPHAIQVTDRWHLLHNLTEAFQRYLATEHTLLRQVAKEIPEENKTQPAMPAITDDPLGPPTRAEQIRNTNRDRRHARYDSVMELVRQGLGIKTISRALNIDRRTVRRWKRAGRFPERVPVHRRSSVDPFGVYLQQRYNEGCHHAAQLWRELRERGFGGTQRIVRHWVRRLRPQHGRHRAAPSKIPTACKITGSPRQTAWLLLRPSTEAAAFSHELFRRSPDVKASAAVACEFVRMVRDQDANAWFSWQQMAQETRLASFARNLRHDEAAVLAALRLPWSNGQVEGQVHRLKLIKRQMYGRAKFDLLRLRVLPAA